MRRDRGSNEGLRSSALWGKSSKGETRSSALWGKGGRGFLTTLVIAVTLAVPVAANAGSDRPGAIAFTSPGLLQAAKASPNARFSVIVQSDHRRSSAYAAGEVRSSIEQVQGKAKGLRRQFSSVSAVAAELTGKQILNLVRKKGIVAVTEDAPVQLASLSNTQRWPYVASLQRFWGNAAPGSTPTIAVVDSGIDASRADFAGRVLTQVSLTSLSGNTPGDGRGHGTFVAGIAAGSGNGYAGAAPGSKIVSLDVMDDNGMAMTRDVIAAADWILKNKDAYGIRVANFSLHSSQPNSFMYDPLDRAVEKLWFSGVVVVAAAGNYAVDGQPSGVPFAPGNDPFVITVGADDINGSMSAKDDKAAPWSAYGYTLDGFAKPDLAAPGRYIVGPVPASSTLVRERPASVVAPGYIQLSGTSFAAPIVAGAAAQVLAAHPAWTPDQVKGALMLTAKATPEAAPLSNGVGVVDAGKAASLSNAPNPNAALNKFLSADPAGGPTPVFNAASWANAARADASWSSASWADASWASASWSSASWASASWADASWASASWASASWGSASWADASWASVSYADNAEGDASPEGGELVEPGELEALATELGLAPEPTPAAVSTPDPSSSLLP